MTQYWKLRTIRNAEHRAHVADRLRDLRSMMRREVVDKLAKRNFRLATWNIMHFGGGGSYERDTDAMLYIAEIIDHFDLVAIQEVKQDLTQLEDLVNQYLGSAWDYIVTDASGGDLGNDERMAFLYRKEKVTFTRLAGEIVLPDGQTVIGDAGLEFEDRFDRHAQFSRSPFVVGFQVGWFKFKLCTVHIYFGNPSQPDDMSDEDYSRFKKEFMEVRKAEIREIAKYMAERQDDERKSELKRLKMNDWDTEQSEANYILLGDFNIVSPEHETMAALRDNGFEVPEDMEALHTNLGKKKAHYDQIAQRFADPRVEYQVSGAVDFRKAVFRTEDAEHYIDVVKDKQMATDRDGNARTRDSQIDYFNKYRFKQQMSDHQLLWSAFDVDFADSYLEKIEQEARAEIDID